MKLFHYLLILSIIMASSCASLKVVSEAPEKGDLGKYNFYTIADTDKGFLPQVNPTQKMQIEQAIAEQASHLSTVKNNSGVTGPDVLINYFVVIDSKQDIETYTDYYGRRRWQLQTTDINIREYKEGTLLLDFIDAKTKKVVWHGSTTGVVTTNSVKMEKKINEAVKAIFNQYKKDQVK